VEFLATLPMTDSGVVRKIMFRDAIREALAEEMRRDPNVFLMGEEVAQYNGAYKASSGLLEEFGPKRVIDTPISEHGFTGLAVGAALRKLRPVVEFMSFNFSMQAMDQIINSAAKISYMSGGKLNCPIVFRGANGASFRLAGQHSQCFASWYAHCPGLKVVAPYDSQSAKGMLKAAIRDPNPVIFLENERLYAKSFDIQDDGKIIDLDKAVIRKHGKDVTLIGYSLMVEHCLQAAEILAKEHSIDAEVIDLCSLRPMDVDTIIRSLEKTHRVVITEAGWTTCGVGAEVIALINEHGFDQLDAPPCRVSGADVPMPYAKGLEAAAIPSTEQIVSATKALFSRS